MYYNLPGVDNHNPPRKGGFCYAGTLVKCEAMDEVTADTYIEDIVHDRPDLVGFLAKLGLVCQKCSDPFWGTLGELCRIKGLDVEDIISQVNAAKTKGE